MEYNIENVEKGDIQQYYYVTVSFDDGEERDYTVIKNTEVNTGVVEYEVFDPDNETEQIDEDLKEQIIDAVDND